MLRLASIESSFSFSLQRRQILMFISLFLGRVQARWRGRTVLWFNSLSIFSLYLPVFSYTPLSLYYLSTYIIILIDCGLLRSFRVFLLSFFIFDFALSILLCLFLDHNELVVLILSLLLLLLFLTACLGLLNILFWPISISATAYIFRNRKDTQITWKLH